MNCSTRNGKRTMNRATASRMAHGSFACTNVNHPILFHSSVGDRYAKDRATIQSQNALGTNVDLNTTRLTAFQHNHVL